MKQTSFSAKPRSKSDNMISETLHSLTDIKRTYLNLETVSQPSKQNSLKLGPTVSITPESLKQQIFSVVEQNPQPALGKLGELIRGWLGQKWKVLRSGVSSRLTKLKYLLPSLVGESFGRTEKEVLEEWTKNALLDGLQYLWSHVFVNWKFANIEEITEFYNSIRLMVAKLSYLLFQPSLHALHRQNVPVESRLYNMTAVEVITTGKEWVYVVERAIKPRLLSQTVSFSQNYDLGDLDARPEIVEIDSKGAVLQKTAESLKKLVRSYSKEEILNSLRQYRANLLKEITANVESWSRRKNCTKQITVEKEDILSCVIFALVHYKIDDIGCTLKYLSFLWGAEMEKILGSYQVDSYRVDLEVAYSYLTQPVATLSIASLEKLEVCI